MHFFADPTNFDTQTAAQAFGPDPSDPTNKYNISSRHAVTGLTRIYACQDSVMLVQPAVDASGTPVTGLVNVILKPLDGLTIKMQPVKYYIYRGLDRSTFLNGTAIVDEDPSNTTFIDKLWDSWNVYWPIAGLTSSDKPTAKSFGFDDGLTATGEKEKLVEEYFNSETSTVTSIQDYQAIKVKEGEWIGNVLASGTIDFEIITDSSHLVIDLEYVQKPNQLITASGVIDPNTPSLAATAARDKVLNYIDPAAFFGMHFDAGVYVSTASTSPDRKRKEDLVSGPLSVFLNKEVVYLDVRSEKGYSLGYYLNYRNGDAILELKSKLDLSYETLEYTTMHWPLVNLTNNPPANLNVINNGQAIKLRLSVKYNKTPLLFAENPQLFGRKNKNNFISGKDLFNTGSTDDYTKAITLFTPYVTSGITRTNVAHHIKLQYFRLLDDTTSPGSVFKKLDYLDSAFGGIYLPQLLIPNTFLHEQNTKRHLVNGPGFTFVADTGVYYEEITTPLVMFYSDLAYSFQSSGNNSPKFNLGGSVSYEGVLKRKNVIFSKQQITVSAVNIDVLTIVGYNRTSQEATPMENLHLLGLTKAEWEALNAATTAMNLHQKYVVFETPPGAPFTDDATKPYLKFKLKIQGLDTNLQVQEVSSFPPYGDLIVYGTTKTMLCSPAFAAAKDVAYELPDPGVMTEFEDAYLVEYNGTDQFVKDLFAGGTVTTEDNDYQNIADPNNTSVNLGFQPTPDVGLIGDLYYPVDKVGKKVISTKQLSYPLIVICHGNGQRYSNYRVLAKHLAMNGFIVVSINELAYYYVSLFTVYPLTDITFDNPLSTTNGYIVSNQVRDALYIYNNDSSSVNYEKMSVLEGGFVGGSFNNTNEVQLSWKKGDEFETMINPVAQIWERTGSAPATGITDFGISWTSNSGVPGSLKADLTRMAGATMVELTATEWAYDKISDIAPAITGGTDIPDIEIPYPDPAVNKYLGTFYGGILYLIKISSTTSAGGTVKIFAEVKNRQVRFNIDIGQHGMGILGRSNMVYPHIQIVKSYIEQEFGSMGVTIQNSIGLIGHSRGAEAVVRCAKDIGSIPRVAIPFPSGSDTRPGSSKWRYLPGDLYHLSAVISLAPTDQSDDRVLTPTRESIAEDIPYYVLYGALDGDVDGQPDTANPNRTGGFSIYDRSVNETEKAMSFVYGATHNGFITNDLDFEGVGTLAATVAKQQVIAKAYMNAFMRTHLKGETFWGPYFYGDAIPPSTQYEAIYPQYKNMYPSSPNRWYVSDPSTATITLDSVAPSTTASAPFAVGGLLDLDGNSPHESLGLKVTWTQSTANPCVLSIEVDSAKQDASGYGYLSFRIGHRYNASTYPDLGDIIVKISDSGSQSSQRAMGRTIPPPDPREANLTKSAMITVRLPLNSFTGTANLAIVQKVDFLLPGAGSVLMDDFEFTD